MALPNQTGVINMTRTRFIKIRVSEIELEEIKTKATEADLSISDLFRQLILNTRIRQNRSEKELIRQIARIGSNINQLARWANTRKNRPLALETVLWLNRIYNSVKQLGASNSIIALNKPDYLSDKEQAKDAN